VTKRQTAPKAAREAAAPAAATPQVFDYLDYRAFLRDYYVAKKATRSLSFRSFSKRAGLGSPNYLKLVMEGQRNLTPAMAVRFAKAAALEGDAARYFRELVRFGQAKTSAERNEAYAKISGFRRYRDARPLELAHAAYCSTWYLPAIRELSACRDFQDDPHWIAGALRPKITPAEAAQALQTLVELGLLERKPSGKIVQGEPLLSTGPEVQSLSVGNYHRAMMERAADSIDIFEPEERDISSLTLCLGAEGVRRLKERIQRFRRELLELSTRENNPRQVLQINFQIFPLSRGARS
jgi:uncharacterized protein (TIGR02147 family)